MPPTPTALREERKEGALICVTWQSMHRVVPGGGAAGQSPGCLWRSPHGLLDSAAVQRSLWLLCLCPHSVSRRRPLRPVRQGGASSASPVEEESRKSSDQSKVPRRGAPSFRPFCTADNRQAQHPPETGTPSPESVGPRRVWPRRNMGKKSQIFDPHTHGYFREQQKVPSSSLKHKANPGGDRMQLHPIS